MRKEYTAIITLGHKLLNAGIPFQFSELFNGGHICYPNNNINICVCSVIEHDGSYGRKENLLEICGLMTPQEEENTQDNVLGCLSVENVFNRINEHYKLHKEEYKE